MIVELPRRADAIALLLLDEPADIADIRDIRHWVRVYANLLELAADFPPRESQSASLSHRLAIWGERLDFWQRRAREVTSPRSPTLRNASHHPNEG
ncbi:MAG: hypothetical protein M3Z11_07580 [Candidatus Dormibacteraeota bacterium]|nr:hypothetical protein [Candidatus Dormibacteraeota bacterium]